MEKSVRLITKVLDLLKSDPQFAEKLKNKETREQALKDVLSNLHNEGYHVITSKADMQAIAALNIDNFVKGCKPGAAHPDADPLC